MVDSMGDNVVSVLHDYNCKTFTKTGELWKWLLVNM